MGRRKPQHCPSFFKVLINDFTNKLPIPPAFVNELKGKLPSTPVLKTECGGSWEVEIKEVGQKYCFLNGWLEFVNFHKLQEYNFLVFCLIDDSIFQVTIYDPTCCEKKLHPPTKIEPVEKSNPRGSYTERLKKPRYNTKDLEADMEIKIDDDEPKAYYPSPKIEDQPCFVSALKKTSKENMMIPKEFVRKYGKNLADSVFLKAPNGAFWQVELERNKSEVWLHNGWREFRTYYSICFGHVLVFGYEGNSLFHVIIFDKSASEIEYPMSDTHIEQANLIHENAQASSNKRMKTKHTDEQSIKLEEDLDSHGSMQEAKGKGVPGLRLASEATDKAIEAATKFVSKSKYPSFKSVMWPTYLLKGFLHLPTSFSTHMKRGMGKVRIEALDNSWEVRLVAGKLSGGWRRCVRDNSLQLDDVCVFELINKNDSVLKLSIFRRKNI